jgi:hypothetical protein
VKGKSFITENRELAFKKYCECGGNVEMTIRALEKEDLKLSKKTFYEWMKKFNFEERRTKVDVERQIVTDSQISFEERMLSDLLKQKEKYEKYFEGITGIDNQAQFAYAGIIGKLFDIKMKLNAFKAALFIDFMKDLVSYFSKHDPDAVPVIEKNFDDFMAFARMKYA